MALIPKKRRDALRRIEPLDEPTSGLMAPHRQCTATSKRTGKQCGRFCAPGMKTCNMHGSATRRSKTAAAKRIAQASGYAAEMLVEFMADPAVDLKLRATIAQDLLSRANVTAKAAIELSVPDWQSRIEASVVNWGELNTGETSDYDANVEDAVIVYDDPDEDPDMRRARKNREIAGRVSEPQPGRRGPSQQQAAPPSIQELAYDPESFSEKRERLHQESRRREMGLDQPSAGGSRSSTARMGRPRR